MLLSGTASQKCRVLHWRGAHFKSTREIMLLLSFCKSSTNFLLLQQLEREYSLPRLPINPWFCFSCVKLELLIFQALLERHSDSNPNHR